MTPERIDRILADFRGWLEGLASLPPADPPAEPFGLHQLTAQFTALRHDVNMQTKAARTAVEQTNAAIQLLQPADEPAEDGERLRPVVKTLLDVHDALGVAQRQVEKAARSIDDVEQASSPRPGLFARLFGATPHKMPDPAGKLRRQLAAAADGYAMSLRRIERTFPELGLEPIPCDGEPFDPETMEVVDTTTDAGLPPGTVVEVLRPGYFWHDTLFRFAQVKVAR